MPGAMRVRRREIDRRGVGDRRREHAVRRMFGQAVESARA